MVASGDPRPGPLYLYALLLDLAVLGLLFAATAVYYGFGIGILQEGGYSDSVGLFTFSLGVAFLVLGLGLRGLLEEDRPLMIIVFGLAITFLTVSVAVQFDPPWIAITWAIEAAMLLLLGFRSPLKDLRWAGGVVLGISLFASLVVDFQAGRAYSPEALAFSTESLTLVLQIAVLYGAAYLIWKDSTDQTAAVWAIVLAQGLKVLWLSLEARAHFDRMAVPNQQAYMFTITAIWSIYAAGLMIVGVAARLRLARLMSVVLFGLVIFKVAIIDLWFLPTGYRVIAFMGLGALLLAVSLLYQRFRDFILSNGGDQEQLASTP